MIKDARNLGSMACPIGANHPSGWLKCVGEHCMAWQWLDDPSVEGGERRGYCGMVGKPEVGM